MFQGILAHIFIFLGQFYKFYAIVTKLQKNNIKDQNCSYKYRKMSYYRAQIEYEYCCQRRYYPDNGYQSSNRQPYYIISPLNIGRSLCLLQKYQFLFGSIDMKINNKRQLSPLFKYVLKCQVAFDMITYQKRLNGDFSKYLDILLRELKSGEMKVQEFKVTLLQNFINIIKDKQKTHQKIEKFVPQVKSDIIKKFPRYKKMLAYDSLVAQYTYQCLNELKGINKEDYELSFGNIRLFTPQILIKQAKKLQFLRKPVLHRKLRALETKYESLYGTKIMSQGSSKNSAFILKINKLFRQNQPIVQSIQSMIQMRTDQIDYRSQSLQIITKVWNQFKRYNKGATHLYRKDLSEFYHYINPENIVFNQSSLNVKLHYHPFYYQALGLSKQPCTVMTRLAFFPTHKPFNYFRSLPQLSNLFVKRVLNDHFFGNKDFIEQKSQNYIEQFYEKEIQESAKIRQEQSIYKFILTCYYILNTKQYGRTTQLLNYSQTQQHFIQELQTLKKTLQYKFEKLQDYIGISNKKTQKIHFNFDMRSLQQYFISYENQQDSVVKSLKYHKIQKYFKLRLILINQINGMMMQDNLFFKMSNVKRYIVIYLIAVDEYLTQIQMINDIQKQKYDERKELKEYMNKHVTKKTFIFKKDSISALDALAQVYSKIQQYSRRDQGSDSQSKYLNQDVNGIKMFNSIKEFQEIKDKLIKLQNQIVKLQKSERDGTYRQKYKKRLDQANKLLQQNKNKYQNILKEYLFQEMRPYDKNLHKYPQNPTQQIKEYYNLVNQKLQLLVRASQTLNFENNSLLYEMSVLPLFRIVDGECFNTERITAENNRIDKINFENIVQICQNYPTGDDKEWQKPVKKPQISMDGQKYEAKKPYKPYNMIDIEKQRQKIRRIAQGSYRSDKKYDDSDSDSDSNSNQKYY